MEKVYATNIVKFRIEKAYFTSRIVVTFETNEPLWIAFPIDYVQHIARALNTDSADGFIRIQCDSETRIILYKYDNDAEKRLFTGSDVDFPLVTSIVKLPFKVYSSIDILIEVWVHEGFKARFGNRIYRRDNGQISKQSLPPSYFKVGDQIIDLYPSEKSGMEYKLGWNVHFLKINKSDSFQDCYLYLKLLPKQSIVLGSIVPWFHTALVYLLWLILPAEYDIYKISLMIGLFYTGYGGYLAWLLRSGLTFISCIGVHWVILLSLISILFVALYSLKVMFVKINNVLLGIAALMIAFSLMNTILIVKYHFTGDYPYIFKRLFAFPNLLYNKLGQRWEKRKPNHQER